MSMNHGLTGAALVAQIAADKTAALAARRQSGGGRAQGGDAVTVTAQDLAANPALSGYRPLRDGEAATATGYRYPGEDLPAGCAARRTPYTARPVPDAEDVAQGNAVAVTRADLARNPCL